MKYLIAIALLYNFDANAIWWTAFAVISCADILGISYSLYVSRSKPPVTEPNLKDIVKLDGTPYTYEDLQNIWNNGYENGYSNATMTKQ